ncbi:MAG: RNA pseudouridine synthase, partial [Myxococcota bacterium]
GYGAREPGILHRLDTNTSGLVIAARTDAAFTRLRDALRGGEIDKRYKARVVGRVRAPQVLDAPLRATGKRMSADFDARDQGDLHALTEVLASTPAPGGSLVEVRARSARRHQVRAHLAAYGHPLIGDVLYAGPPSAPRHLLHACAITFESSGARRTVSADPPADFDA